MATDIESRPLWGRLLAACLALPLVALLGAGCSFSRGGTNSSPGGEVGGGDSGSSVVDGGREDSGVPEGDSGVPDGDSSVWDGDSSVWDGDSSVWDGDIGDSAVADGASDGSVQDAGDAETVPPPDCEDDSDCVDAFDCTVNRCVGGVCEFQPDDAQCDDGHSCTTNRCDATEGCIVDGTDDSVCDDSVSCTEDLCVADEGCTNTPRNGWCVDDGIPCTEAECDPTDGCQASVFHDELCDDGVDCTADSCTVTGCDNVADDSACGAGETCTSGVGCGLEFWVDGSCDPDCGEGTMAVPHETIDDAVADAVSGVWSIIHIEEGLYAEPRFEFTNADDQLAFIGIGEVEWSVDSGDEVLEVVDAQVFLQGLTLNGDKRGLVCEGDARCTGRQLIIRGSSERGIRTKDRAVVDLDRVFVTGNEGGGIIAEGAVKIRAVNSIFANNGSRSKEGGAIYLKGEKAVLELFNSTLADNQATDAAGAVSVEKIDKLPPITAANLLLWNNSTDGDGLECMGCDLGADSLQGEDPLFWMADGERADALDYRINSLSPARGRAKTLSILEQWDYFGNDRGGGAWDSGAHEFQ